MLSSAVLTRHLAGFFLLCCLFGTFPRMAISVFLTKSIFTTQFSMPFSCSNWNYLAAIIMEPLFLPSE